MPQCEELVHNHDHKLTRCHNEAEFSISLRRVVGMRFRCRRCLSYNMSEGVVEVAYPLIPDSPRTDSLPPNPV